MNRLFSLSKAMLLFGVFLALVGGCDLIDLPPGACLTINGPGMSMPMCG